MASGADASAGSGAGRVDGGGGAEAGVIVGGGGGGGAGSPTIGTPFVKPLVAVDLDEVLGAFVEALAQWHNTVFGTKLTTADFRSYHFSDVWGGTTEEAVAKVRDFYASNEFTGLSPLAAAFETLRQHSTFLRFAVVTSRQHVVADKTRAWLDRHFPGIFETIVFANHYGDAGSGTTRSKSDICRELGAVALIDDNLAYALECAPALPVVILFGEYPWNSGGGSGRAGDADAAAAAGAGAAPTTVPSPTSAGTGPASTPSTAPARLPGNVVRAINWRHVSALLHRLRIRPEYGAGRGGGGGDDGRGVTKGAPGKMPVVDARQHSVAAGLIHRDSMTVFPTVTSSGTAPTTVDTCADNVRRAMEVQDTISLTATGHTCRIIAETADALQTAGEAVVTHIRTGADAAPDGKPRFPRLTITLQRSPTFLLRRFSAGPRFEAAASSSAGVAAAAAVAPALLSPGVLDEAAAALSSRSPASGGTPSPAPGAGGGGGDDAAARGAHRDGHGGGGGGGEA